MLVLFVVLVVAVRLVFVVWPRGKPHARIAYACCALLVLLLALVPFLQGYRRRMRAHPSTAAPAASNAPLALPAPAPEPPQSAPAAGPRTPAPAGTEAPSAAGQEEAQLQMFQANGCKLSAPATWAVQTQPANSAAKLVISDSSGGSSVGIHYEAATGSKLTEQDVDQLMREANRMPLKLIDSGWTVLDQRKAWRELRVGSINGANRVWIRYSYQVGANVAQVIGVQTGERAPTKRELLETVMKSTHCE
jgi:hypothetical protein